MNHLKSILITLFGFSLLKIAVIILFVFMIICIVIVPMLFLEQMADVALDSVYDLIAFFENDEDYKILFNRMVSREGNGNIYLEWYFPHPQGYKYEITDSFGNDRSYGGDRKHLGVDIMCKEDTPIIAVEEGEITAMGWNKLGGWRIGITSGFGDRYWYYAHMRKIHPYIKSLKIGSKIYAGQVIGYVGSTGYSDAVENGTMPENSRAVDKKFEDHLHIQVSQYGEWLDPYKILKFVEYNKVKITDYEINNDLVSILNKKENRLIKENVGTLSEKEFINKVGNESAGLHEKYKIFPSISISQACLESNYGNSGLAQKGNNLYGIKADRSWMGATITMNTQEYINGQWITIAAKFRAYPSWRSSILDHAKFLHEHNRYSVNGVFRATTYKKQAKALQRAGYATDPNYADKLINMINFRGLYKYD